MRINEIIIIDTARPTSQPQPSRLQEQQQLLLLTTYTTIGPIAEQYRKHRPISIIIIITTSNSCNTCDILIINVQRVYMYVGALTTNG